MKTAQAQLFSSRKVRLTLGAIENFVVEGVTHCLSFMINEHCGDDIADEFPSTELPACVEASLAFRGVSKTSLLDNDGTPQVNRTAVTEEIHEFIAEHDGEEGSNDGRRDASAS
jgi:hypothetical protein